jgi:hypothetical protein
MQEFAERVASFRAGDHKTTLALEGVPGSDLSSLPIVLAPYEFCLRESGFERCDRDVALERSVLANTEQPETSWVSACEPRLHDRMRALPVARKK